MFVNFASTTSYMTASYGGNQATTLALGEEGGTGSPPNVSTMALGEEGGNNCVPPQKPKCRRKCEPKQPKDTPAPSTGSNNQQMVAQILALLQEMFQMLGQMSSTQSQNPDLWSLQPQNLNQSGQINNLFISNF